MTGEEVSHRPFVAADRVAKVAKRRLSPAERLVQWQLRAVGVAWGG